MKQLNKIRFLVPALLLGTFLSTEADSSGLISYPLLANEQESEVALTTATYPSRPPHNVDSHMDRLQMLWQLGITEPPKFDKEKRYSEILAPLLKKHGSHVTLHLPEGRNPDALWNWSWAPGSEHLSSTGENYVDDSGIFVAWDGFWTNYIQAWEPGGKYFTGEQFYPPLALSDLTGITKENWPQRRAQIFEEVQKIWGRIPAQANALKIDWKISNDTTGISKIGGRDVPWREYTLTGVIDISSYPQVNNAPVIRGRLRIPTNLAPGKKAPLIVNNMVRSINNELWSQAAIHGIAVFAYDCVALQPDNGTGLTSYLIGLVNKGNWRKPDDWGAMAAWGWGVSRLIDYLEQHPESGLDATRVAMTGHSRGGKTALLTMAYEPRLSSAFPSSSGSLGVKNARRHWGQDLETSAIDIEYHWMAGNFMKYVGVHPSSTDGYLPRRVMDMPVDGESLLMLCAPRPLFIGMGDNLRDPGCDPYGEYLSAVAATPLYELLGAKGIVMHDVMEYKGQAIPYPQTDKAYLQGDIAYRRHHGGHTSIENYDSFVKFLLKYWK